MPATLEAISQEALVLTPEERIELAHRLLDSVEPEVDSEMEDDVEAAWDKEIKRRIEDLRSGKTVAVPAEEVFAELRAIAPGP